jgi:hypothetical protein
VGNTKGNNCLQKPKRMLRNALMAVNTRIHHHGVRGVPVEYCEVSFWAIDVVSSKQLLTLHPMPTAKEVTKSRAYHH